jgi:hypothetical protein
MVLFLKAIAQAISVYENKSIHLLRDLVAKQAESDPSRKPLVKWTD